ncbi:60S ribosomal protein L16, putative [Entamoeba invadens IP1]|uniref:60S ribosomal protein L16, putative n=1 Tax=Entamoeba invadens IP1 TaxID=370355 RepID=A0A0A1TYP0_ENTIV|nr:60S ribosomal protein L16, putative [Entamoeba invadens IP1]ELP86588.1 60S ribosomal protein L16, putative [Entamoeba invadens IP1]|eukprot:XP_004185934.1 60S ribosomal protein L16, putative [Entamoeba invadens IP1]
MEGRKRVIVVDCKGHVLGRVASTVAKQLLLGRRIVLVRCEQLEVCGTLRMRLVKWEMYRRKRVNTNPLRGPYHQRSPSKMVYKAIRGMLPKHNFRGKSALSHVKCFEGCPAPYDKMKKSSIPEAAVIYNYNPTRKRTLLGTLGTAIGWKYADVVKRDEEIRKARGKKYYEAKVKKTTAMKEAREKVLADKKYEEKVKILKQFGYA